MRDLDSEQSSRRSSEWGGIQFADRVFCTSVVFGMTMASIGSLSWDDLRGDLYGGLTAAVVAIPLALAFGVASGAGPIAGLYGAVAVGLLAALFGGTPAQVSGPTGPMTVVMAGVIASYAHKPALAFTVVILAGLFQILFGLLKLGRYVNLIPYPVVSGFMSGIGILILLLQMGPLLGHVSASGGPWSALAHLSGWVAQAEPDSVLAGLLSLALVYLWPARLQRIFPGPLVALTAGTAAVLYLLPDAPVIGEIPSGLPAFVVPAFEAQAVPGMVKSALVLALLGSIDSLLTALIADVERDSVRPLLDSSAGLAIEEAIVDAQRLGKEVFLVGLNLQEDRILGRLGVLDLLPATRHHVERLQALRQAARLVGLNPERNPPHPS